ncbi:MAG: hypothetical protein J6I62_04415 [Selenomonadaceae bacterium]|nr:hypothetical protein [Selenomonadaceae bacterium]
MASLTIDNELSEKATKAFAKEGLSLKEKDEIHFEVKENPYSLAYKKYEDKFKGAAKEAGFESEEEFNDYFFNEFRPAFLEERKKEHGCEKDIDMYENNNSPIIAAFREAQEAFEGFAEEEGLKSEDDVVKYIKDLRGEFYEEWKQKRNARH